MEKFYNTHNSFSRIVFEIVPKYYIIMKNKNAAYDNDYSQNIFSNQ